jgi:cystathionine gamma-synthase
MTLQPIMPPSWQSPYPIIYSQELGTSLPPNDPYAISVSLPSWQDVVDYEEGLDRVRQKLQTGYPRFVLHPIIQELCAVITKSYLKPHEMAWPFWHLRDAQRGASYLYQRYQLSTRTMVIGPLLSVLVVDTTHHAKAKEIWQHTGLGISARHARYLLDYGLTTSTYFSLPENQQTILPSYSSLRGHLAQLSGEKEENIFLFPSGMAAIFTAYQLIKDLNPTLPTCQLGFPYLDTLKIQEKWGEHHYINYQQSSDIEQISNILTAGCGAVFAEFPTNPLLNSIDLERLRTLRTACSSYVPLILDDTLTGFSLPNIAPYADIRVTSLSKYYNGMSNVLAGSLILSNKSPHYPIYRKWFDEHYQPALWPEDASLLFKNGQDCLDRVQHASDRAFHLSTWLHTHPAIRACYYPKYQQPTIYDSYRSHHGGYGSLFSLVFDSKEKAACFYDHFPLAKGPGLGSHFTMCCPYTLLAHYDELEKVAQYGVPAALLRFSIGVEPLDHIRSAFEQAFSSLEP